MTQSGEQLQGVSDLGVRVRVLFVIGVLLYDGNISYFECF